MTLGIMQPYFFPYIGYFQLMNAVDEFVVYDKIKYTKKGWINRNRILSDGKDIYITIPLKKDSDSLDVRERFLADTWGGERIKILNKIKESYRKSPFFGETYNLIEDCIMYEEKNLFLYIFNSLIKIKEYLEIPTKLIVSSGVEIDHELKAADKVMAICKARKADIYINPIGGVELYDKEIFNRNGIELKFIKTKDFEYPQFENVFIPFLSIIDVMMFNSKEKVKEYLSLNYSYHEELPKDDVQVEKIG